jgi:hypothetical protein
LSENLWQASIPIPHTLVAFREANRPQQALSPRSDTQAQVILNSRRGLIALFEPDMEKIAAAAAAFD